MDFVIQWLWYLLAFAAGSGVAWVIVTGSIKRTGEEEVHADATGPTEMGARR
jgi:uncharacterized membrane protein ArfB